MKTFEKVILPVLKRALFLLLAPIYGALFLFMNLTFKWWESLAE